MPVQNTKNFSGEGKEFYGHFQSCVKSRTLFTQTIRWNLAHLVKIYLSWNHRTSTLRQFGQLGLPKGAARTTTEGTSAAPLQLGLDEKWWDDFVECFLRNVQDLLEDGKTPYERRFGEPFKGPNSFWSNG